MFSSREELRPTVPGEPSDDDLGVDTGTDIIVRDDSADLSRAWMSLARCRNLRRALTR